MALIFSISSPYWPTFNFSIIVSLHTSFLSKPFTLDPTIFTPIFPPNADEDSIKTSSSLFTSRGSFHPQDISTNLVSIYPAVKKTFSGYVRYINLRSFIHSVRTLF